MGRYHNVAIVAAMVVATMMPQPIQAQSPPSATPTPQAAPPQSATPPAPSSGKLTGAAAWQSLVGNTIVADSRAGSYSEFFSADHLVKHLDKDGMATGSWKLQGDKVCFDYPEEDDASCVDVELDGAKGAFVDEDAARDRFDVLPGNAKSL